MGQRIVDEGLVSVKLMESRMVGTDRYYISPVHRLPISGVQQSLNLE